MQGRCVQLVDCIAGKCLQGCAGRGLLANSSPPHYFPLSPQNIKRRRMMAAKPAAAAPAPVAPVRRSTRPRN